MGEGKYQAYLVKKLRQMFVGCEVFRNNPNQRQGILDLLILYEGRWAMLEVKTSADAEVQPNQPYYVEKFNEMSFAAFIYPENEEQVLSDLQRALRPSRQTRLSKSKQQSLA